MGTSTLPFTVFRSNGINSGMLSAVFNPAPPGGTVPPPPPLGAVPLEVDKEINLIDFLILSVVSLVSWIPFLILIRIPSKIISVCTFCSNLPC